MRFLFINGPNVNITRFTEPGVEGEVDYNGLLDYLDVCCQQMGIEPDFFQSNHEGDIIDEIQSAAGAPTASSSIRAAMPITAWPFWKRCSSAVCPPWRCS